ncbi:MAG: DUF5320 domain-containing protein [bacterium]|nr:DUF5320 domain-containing protein [bacterium]
MPAGNGTGPMGVGPMTGRAAGYCAGYPVPGFANPVPGRGFGMGFGRGGGFGRGRGRGPGGFGFGRGGAYPYAAPSEGMPYAYPNAPIMTQGQEADMLKAQAEGLSSALEDINKRISDLESQARKQ